MLENGRGLIKALENWAKKVTEDYQDVEVRDLSTSFRDGMAFCAIIHHYRPDLIDFDSLSKGNIFENNSLAFGVAEKQLGVPALLDAEDMVKYEKPDRLSIITYLSQLRNCFENQNKVKSRADFKRIQKPNSGPPAKVAVLEPTLLPTSRHEVCQICKHRVFILERLIVDSKLYHTTCFRCHKCNCLLNPGAYVESDVEGVYECSVCPVDEPAAPVTPKPPPRQSLLRNPAEIKFPEPLPVAVKIFNTSEVINFAQSNLSPEADAVSEGSSALQGTTDESSSSPKVESFPRPTVSIKDKISAFESSQSSEPLAERTASLNSSQSFSESSNTPKTLSKTITAKNNGALPQSLISPDVSLSERHDSTSKSSLESKQETVDSSLGSSGISTPPVSDSNQSKDMPSLSSGRAKLRTSSYLNQSPLSSPKAARDIFKTSLQPLRLPTSLKKDSPTPSRRTFEVPALRTSPLSAEPTLRKNLLYHSSKSVFSDSGTKSEDVSDASNRGIPRRKSLESGQDEKSAEADAAISGSSELDGKSKPSTVSNQVDSGKKITSSVSKSLNENLPSDGKGQTVPPQTPLDPGEKENSFNPFDEPPSLPPDSKTSTPLAKPDKPLSEGKSKIPALSVTEASPKTTLEEEYPDDLNPFGDDDNDETESAIKAEVEYPDELNPFGDDDEEEVTNESLNSTSQYDDSLNPFASDDDETSNQTPPPPSKFPWSERPSSTPLNSLGSNLSSPSGSLKGTLRKRPAPKPPAACDIFPRDSSVHSGSSKTPERRTPTPRKNKPAPPPPPASPEVNREAASESPKSRKEVKRKKRPAPPVPIRMQKDMKKIPLKEILREMKEIEEKQREFEKQGREIELLIRDRDKDDEASVEEEELIMQLFELVNQKNALFRRQAELMYIKRSQRLEEQQSQIEKEIRLLMEKPESEKTDEDREKEQELTLELIDIVDQRNSIIDSIEMDRRRELEEDHSVKEQLELKNGDLPIAAEIQEQKSSGKKKKHKDKKSKDKDKKPKDKDSKPKDKDSGKGTLRKNLFSRKS